MQTGIVRIGARVNRMGLGAGLVASCAALLVPDARAAQSAPPIAAMLARPVRELPAEVSADLLHVAIGRLDAAAPPVTLMVLDTGTFTIASTPDGPLGPLVQVLGSEGMGSADSADVNGDGLLDLLATVDGVQALRLRLADGEGGFLAPMTLPTDGQPTWVRAADADGDGVPDLVFALHGEARILIRRNLGAGHFGPLVGVLSPPFPGPVRFGDLDGDGLRDLVVAGQDLRWLRGLGDLQFGPGELVAQFPEIGPVADFNGDGFDDLASQLDGPAYLPSAVVFLGGPNGPVLDGWQPLSANFVGTPVCAVDLDADGRSDLLANSSDELYGVHVLRQVPAGGFAKPLTVLLWQEGVAVGDLDQDGFLDIVGYHSAAFGHAPHRPGLAWAMGRGDGTFDGLASVGRYVARGLCDLDGDGRLDLVGGASEEVPVVRLRRGTFAGGFGAPEKLDLQLAATTAAAIDDMTGDGVADLVVHGNDGTQSGLVVGQGDGQGHFAALSFAGPGFWGQGDVVETGRLAGPGLPGVFLGSTTILPGTIRLYANEPTAGLPGGTLVELGTTQTGLAAKKQWVVPLDGDGAATLVGLETGSGGSAYLALRDPLAPDPAIWLEHLGWTAAADILDLDDDGDLDVVVAGNLAGPGLSLDIRAYANDGAGNLGQAWQTAFELPADIEPLVEHVFVDAAFGDLTGDAQPELVVTLGSWHSAVCIFDLSTGMPVLKDTLQMPRPLAVAAIHDVDRDGFSDVLARDANNGNVFVLHNTLGPWTQLGHSLAGSAGFSQLLAEGPLLPDTPLAIELRGAVPMAPCVLVAGTSVALAPFKGGTLVPQPDVVLPDLVTDAEGSLQVNAIWPADVPSGIALVLQAWIADSGAPQGASASEALMATVP